GGGFWNSAWRQAWLPLLPITNWYPSGGALATRSEPTVPPAPLGFSTTTCWPRTSLSPWARMRPATSLGPPAANGTTRVSGRVGKFCAGAVPAEASSASIAPKTFTRGFIPRLLMHIFRPWLHGYGRAPSLADALSPRGDKPAIAKLTGWVSRPLRPAMTSNGA